MKNHLETAPVIEAFSQSADCPLCRLRAMLEQESVKRCLGGAVMEPSIRIITNATGFCRSHHVMLMAEKDYHGYALMMQTRLKQVHEGSKSYLNGISSSAWKRRAKAREWSRIIKKAVSSCVICERINDTMNRYMELIIQLFNQDAGFRQLLHQAPALCMIDLPLLLDQAEKHLSGKMQSEFYQVLSEQVEKAFYTAQTDLDALCESFHYGSEQKNNPNIHGALERAVNLLRGKTF